MQLIDTVEIWQYGNRAARKVLQDRHKRLIRACGVANADPEVLAIEREWDALQDAVAEPGAVKCDGVRIRNVTRPIRRAIGRFCAFFASCKSIGDVELIFDGLQEHHVIYGHHGSNRFAAALEDHRSLPKAADSARLRNCFGPLR